MNQAFRFRKACSAAGTTPNHFCDTFGITRATFLNWENGNIPRLSQIMLSIYSNVIESKIKAGELPLHAYKTGSTEGKNRTANLIIEDVNIILDTLIK